MPLVFILFGSILAATVIAAIVLLWRLEIDSHGGRKPGRSDGD